MRTVERILALNLVFLMVFTTVMPLAYAMSPYSLTIDGNGGITDDGQTKYTIELEEPGEIVLPDDKLFTREGYFFMYYTSRYGSSIVYEPGSVYTVTGRRETLYAYWAIAKTYYHSNYPDAGDSEVIEFSFINEYSTYNDDSLFTCDGYLFTGWNTKPDGSGDWYLAGRHSKCYPGAFDLYAQWRPAFQYYLCYSANGDEGIFGGMTYMYEEMDSPIQELQLLALDEGHCWRKDLNAAGAFRGGDHAMFESEQILYYSSIGALNMVANGGHGNDGCTYYTLSSSLGACCLYERTDLEREGYILSSWNQSQDGSGTQKMPGQYAYGTYYAQWDSIEGCNIVYFGNGARTNTREDIYLQRLESYGEVTLVDDVFVSPIDRYGNEKTLLYFLDMYGNIYNPGNTYMFDSQIQLNSIWGKANITYHGNGGVTSSGDEIVNQVVIDSGSYLGVDVFAMDGYLFTGWNSKPDGSGNWYPVASNVDYIGITDLYAQWVPKPEYYITYDIYKTPVLGGKSYEYVALNTELETVALESLENPEDNWELLGWELYSKKYPAGSQQLVAAFDEFTPVVMDRNEGNVIYYSNCEPEIFITQNSNNSNSSWGNIEIYDSYDVTLSVSPFDEDGVHIVSWNESPDGSGNSYKPGNCYTIKSGSNNLKLYAQWETLPDQYIIYNGAGGLTDTGDGTVVVPLESYRNVTLSDERLFTNGLKHIFRWYDNIYMRYYDAGETCDLSGNTTLTAQWGIARIYYHPNFESSGKTIFVQEQMVTNLNYNPKYYKNIYTREGYYFLGWNTNVDGSGIWRNPETEIKDDGIVHLYAQWSEIPEHYVIFDAEKTNVLDGQRLMVIPIDKFPCKVTIPGNKDSLSFKGWYSKEYMSDGAVFINSGRGYYSGTDVTITVNTRFSPASNATCIFEPNGGHTTDGSDFHYSSEYSSSGNISLYLSSTEYHKHFSELTGWNTKADGSGVHYDAETRYSFFYAPPAVLYAEWTEKTDQTDNILVHIDLENEEIGSDCRVYIALYDISGRMIALKEPVFISFTTTGVFTCEVSCQEYIDTYTAKCFICDDNNAPFCHEYYCYGFEK